MHRSTDCPRYHPVLAAALVSLAGLVPAAHAQRWQRPVGTDASEGALDVQFTRDGGSISVGTRAKVGGDVQAFVVKHRADGSVEWDREFGGDRADIAYSVIQTLDGGYAVAFETESAPDGLNLGIYRLDPFGGPIWAFTYTGSFMSDPIHTPHPGPAIEEDPFTRDLLVIGNFRTLPLLMRVDAGGGLVFNRLYSLAGPLTNLAFTDLKIALDQTIVISGSGVRIDPFGVTRQDAFLTRVSPGGVPIWSDLYDSSAFDGRATETGDGLDLRRGADAPLIYLAGRTDFGEPMSPKLGTHYLAVAFGGGAPVFDNSLELSPADPFADDSLESAYAAIRHDAARKQVVVAGRRALPGVTLTSAWAFEDLGPPLLWNEEYARACEGESVDADPLQCGVVVAGVIDSDPWPNGNGGPDIHHLKLNERGDSGCLQTPLQPAQQPPMFQPIPVQLTIDELPERIEYPFAPQEVGSGDTPFCFSPWCFPCPPDVNNDGLVNVNDFFAFLALYQAMSPLADITMDGMINVNDFFAFLALYQAGCV